MTGLQPDTYPVAIQTGKPMNKKGARRPLFLIAFSELLVKNPDRAYSVEHGPGDQPRVP